MAPVAISSCFVLLLFLGVASVYVATTPRAYRAFWTYRLPAVICESVVALHSTVVMAAGLQLWDVVQEAEIGGRIALFFSPPTPEWARTAFCCTVAVSCAAVAVALVATAVTNEHVRAGTERRNSFER